MSFLANLDPTLLIAAGASFAAGLFGYIIARMWIKPIVGYNIAKRKMDQELNTYLQSQAAGNGGSHLKTSRKLALDLDTRYNNSLPSWYRILLLSRKESPAEALKQIGPLSNINDPDQIALRIAAVRRALCLQK